MFCSNCGANNADGAKFCFSCGKPMSTPAPIERVEAPVEPVVEPEVAFAELPDIKYSSATIRNEMAELEEMGYLEQPHTSAGRVPSELGYRFYVDSLVEHYAMTAREIAQINQVLKTNRNNNKTKKKIIKNIQKKKTN